MKKLQIKKELNILSKFKHQNYTERLFDLCEMFETSVNKKMSEIIGSSVYEGVARNYCKHRNHLVFNGIYKLAPIETFLGIIPQENQMEIKVKMESLKDNPFLEQNFELLILAPLNNFAGESNITAIDPVAFAYFKSGENCYERNFLIKLSQWL